MGDRRNLLAELKRRNVWRAAIVYVAAAWALSQGIAQLAPYVGAPDWVVRWFLVACAIGFPFWIAFAWFYAWTPQGFKREEDVEHDPARSRGTGRKLDFWIIGILAVAVVLLVTNQFMLHRDATSTANAAETRAVAAANKAALATLAKVPQKSVAVLPLVNESGNSKQQYFSDGLSEELISDLTQINGLKVIGQYSSFRFRDSKDSPAQIGAALGVANLIEGSVHQNAGRIRIVVNLIRARDGASVWSHSYDQPLKDVFAIQSEIGKSVAAALKVKLLGKSPVNDEKPPSGNVEAYQLMLQGRAIARHETEADLRHGIALQRQAVKLDPNYAFAWGVLSNSLINLGSIYLTGEAQQRAYAEARAAVDRQFALAPNAAWTHIDRGYVLAWLDIDPMGALVEYRLALKLEPNNSGAMFALGTQYGVLGRMQRSIDLFRRAIATDPLRPDWYANLAGNLMAQGHLSQAEQAFHKVLALQANFPGVYLQLSEIDVLRGDAKAAMGDAENITDPASKAVAVTAAKQIAGNPDEADTALKRYTANYGGNRPENVADLYALRKQPDEMFQWLDRARKHNKANVTNNLLNDPLLMRYKSDPRFAALCKQLGLPAPGQPLPGGSAVPASAASL